MTDPEPYFDAFKLPTLYERFNLRNDSVLPAPLTVSDFTIYSTTVKESEMVPVPMPEKLNVGVLAFTQEESVVFDERPCGVLDAIDDTKIPIGYRNTNGLWVSGDHLHLEVNKFVPGLYWVGAQWTPTVSKLVEQSVTGWWWLFTFRDPEKSYPLDFIRGGYVFEKEEDAVCLRAALDVK